MQKRNNPFTQQKSEIYESIQFSSVNPEPNIPEATPTVEQNLTREGTPSKNSQFSLHLDLHNDQRESDSSRKTRLLNTSLRNKKDLDSDDSSKEGGQEQDDSDNMYLSRDSSALISMSIDIGSTAGIANFMKKTSALASRYKTKPRGIADIDRKSLGLDCEKRNSMMEQEALEMMNEPNLR